MGIAMIKNQVPKTSESIFYRERIILLSVGLAIVSWLGEYAAHLLIFDTADAGAGLFPSEPNELWMRTLVAGLIIVFGLFVRSSVRNLHMAKARLVAHKADLASQVQTRTAELAQANRQLQQELNDRVHLESQLDKHRHHLEELLEQRAGELKTTNKHLRQEIIEKEQAESELRESEERYRGLVEGTDNLVTQVGRDGKFIYVNHTAKSVFGLDPKDCIGLSAFDFIHPDDQARTKAAFTAWLSERPEVITYENRQVSRLGKVRSILWTCNLIYDEHGKITVINSIAQDITERKLAEEALQMSEEKYRTLVESISIIPWRFDLNKGEFTFMGSQVEKILGYPIESWTDFKSWSDRIHPDDREAAVETCTRSTEKGLDHDFEYRCVTANGEIIWLRDIVTVRTDPNGVPFEMVGFMIDITERKVAGEALQDSEERFRRLSEAAFESIFITDRGTITESNNQAAEMFGYSTDELQGMPIHKLVAPESRTKVREHVERGFEECYKHMALKKDGTIFLVEVHGKAFPFNGRTFRVTAIADLTDQVKADQEIQMANQISEAKQVALREKNLALKHVLEQLDSEKQEIKAQIQANVDRIVMPTLRLLRKKVDTGAIEYVDLLDSSLKEIASPLANRLQNSYSSLSPGEIEICNMIRNGLASKEIAEFRGVSVQTISMQRKRIRRKLGIAHQAVSLPALLNSITD